MSLSFGSILLSWMQAISMFNSRSRSFSPQNAISIPLEDVEVGFLFGSINGTDVMSVIIVAVVKCFYTFIAPPIVLVPDRCLAQSSVGQALVMESSII